jgi:hypothetical protein
MRGKRHSEEERKKGESSVGRGWGERKKKGGLGREEVRGRREEG